MQKVHDKIIHTREKKKNIIFVYAKSKSYFNLLKISLCREMALKFVEMLPMDSSFLSLFTPEYGLKFKWNI